MFRRFFLIGMVPIALAVYLAEAPMAFGKSLVLCSQVNGRLIDESGAPQPGVRIIRNWTWHWNDKTGSDQTETGPDGNFTLPEVSESSFWAGLAPHEPMIDITVTAEKPDGELLLFAVSKRDYAADAELSGRDLKGPGINVVCRIDQEPDREGPFRGTCRAAD